MRCVITPELGERIADMCESGMSIASAARKLGLNEKTVYGYCTRYAIDPPPQYRYPSAPDGSAASGGSDRRQKRFTASEDRDLLEMREAGFSFGLMAKKLGRVKSSVVTRFATLARQEARRETVSAE